MENQITNHIEKPVLSSFIHLTTDLGLSFDKKLSILDFNQAFYDRFGNYDNSLLSIVQTDNLHEQLLGAQDGKTLELEDSNSNILWKFMYDVTNRLFIGLGHQLDKTSKLDFKKEYEEFIYTVSHDFNESARTIKSLIFFLEKDLKKISKELPNDSIKEINGEVFKLEKRIKGLLTLSRVVRADVQNEVFNLVDTVLQITNRRKYSMITTDLSSEQELSIKTSKKLFQQLLIELLDNALLFTPIENKKIKIGLKKDCISIVDNGVGFSEIGIQNIYKPFYKIPNGIEHDGPGMGLTVADKIIKKLNLGISVFANKTSGSTVTISWN